MDRSAISGLVQMCGVLALRTPKVIIQPSAGNSRHMFMIAAVPLPDLKTLSDIGRRSSFFVPERSAYH